MSGNKEKSNDDIDTSFNKLQLSEEQSAGQHVKIAPNDKGYVGFVPALQADHKDQQLASVEGSQNSVGLSKENPAILESSHDGAPPQSKPQHQSQLQFQIEGERDTSNPKNPATEKRQHEPEQNRYSGSDSHKTPQSHTSQAKHESSCLVGHGGHMRRFGVIKKLDEDIAGLLPHLSDKFKNSANEGQESTPKQKDAITEGSIPSSHQGGGQETQEQPQPGSASADYTKAPMKGNPLQRENIQNSRIEQQNRESNRPEQTHQARHQRGEHVHEDQPGQVADTRLPDITELQRTMGDQEQIKLHDQYHEAIYANLMKPTHVDQADNTELHQPMQQPQQSQSEKRHA